LKPICFIGARAGSKGVPSKNIRMISGKPLIAHTIIKAIKSKIFSHVIVSTEDKKIASIARKFGAEVPFTRPKKYANDTATMEDVLLHGLKKLYSIGYKFDECVLLDATVPFIRIKDIEGSLDLLQKSKFGLVCGVYRQHLNPYYNIVETNSKGFLKLVKTPKKKFRTRQESPKVYQLNGLTVLKVKEFFKNGYNLSKAQPYQIPIESGLMIDTEFELRVADCMFKDLYKL